jgi:hypothetical protein
MNIILKALRFQIFNLVTLKKLYKVNKTWYINFDDFCKLDKYTKIELGDAGVQVVRPS